MMANPLFSQFGGQQINPMQQLIAEAMQLKQTMQNPRAEVERLLQSGAMSQNDFNRFGQMANQVMQMMGGKR